MLKIKNFLGLEVWKHKHELIIEIHFETLNYNNNKMCQWNNKCGSY
jgi:hypothetical protein